MDYAPQSLQNHAWTHKNLSPPHNEVSTKYNKTNMSKRSLGGIDSGSNFGPRSNQKADQQWLRNDDWTDHVRWCQKAPTWWQNWHQHLCYFTFFQKRRKCTKLIIIGCMWEGNTHTPKANTLRGRAAPWPGGESRLPAAIVPPPGLGKIICMRKICKKFDARSMQVYLLQNTALKNEFPPKRAKTEPRGCKITKI